MKRFARAYLAGFAGTLGGAGAIIVMTTAVGYLVNRRLTKEVNHFQEAVQNWKDEMHRAREERGNAE